MEITFRKGTPNDIPELLNCIRELAEYEKAANQVEITEAELLNDGFGPKPLYEFIVAIRMKQSLALLYIISNTQHGKERHFFWKI